MLFWNLWPIWKCKTNVLWINFLFFFALQIINPIHCNPLLKRQNPNETKIKFRARQPPGGSPRVTKSSLRNLQFTKHHQTPIHLPLLNWNNLFMDALLKKFNIHHLPTSSPWFKLQIHLRLLNNLLLLGHFPQCVWVTITICLIYYWSTNAFRDIHQK